MPIIMTNCFLPEISGLGPAPSSIGFGILLVIFICLITLLIALIEAVVMTLLRWDTFRRCSLVSLVMNIASMLANVILLAVFHNPNLIILLTGWLISVLIDSGILMIFKRRAVRQNLIVAVIANTLSYLILIAPAFYYGQK
jgi:hypothetical protein